VELPTFEWSILPPEERDNFHDVSSLAYSLHRHAEQFESAVALFKHVVEPWQRHTISRFMAPPIRPKLDSFRSWPHIVADQGAMILFHFGQSVRMLCGSPNKKIPGALDKCPTVRKRLQNLTEDNLLVGPLSDFWSVRNAVAHAAENHHPDQITRHMADGTFESCSLSGTRCAYTIKGKRCTYEIDDKTVDAMSGVVIEIYSNIDKALLEIRHRAINVSEDGNPKQN